MTERFRSDGQVVLSYLSSLVNIVGDTNVDKHVDLKELYLDANPSPVQVQYVQSVEKGRLLVRALESSLQALFDDSIFFLESIQTFTPIVPKENEERPTYTRLEILISTIRTNSNSLVQCLDSLLTIGQDQSVMGRFDHESSLALERLAPSQVVDGFDEVETIDEMEEEEEEVIDFETAFTDSRPPPFRTNPTPIEPSAPSTALSTATSTTAWHTPSSVGGGSVASNSISQGRNLSLESAARSRSNSTSEPTTPTWGQYDPMNSTIPESASPVDIRDTLDGLPPQFPEEDDRKSLFFFFSVYDGVNTCC